MARVRHSFLLVWLPLTVACGLNRPPLKSRRTSCHWASTLDGPVKCECPEKPVYAGKYEAHFWLPFVWGPGLFSKGREGNGFPWGLVNKLRGSWGGYSVYSKGRRIWFTVAWRSKEMLKSVCNHGPNECWGMVCCSLCCRWRNQACQWRLDIAGC